MSTSFIYHMFGLSGYQYHSQKYVGGSLEIRVSPTYRREKCPVCGCKNIIFRGTFERKLRSLPIGRKPVWLIINVPRVECEICGVVRRIKLGIADARKKYTHAFAKYVIDLSKVMTLQDIARFLGLGWDCVKDIVKSHLEKRYSKANIKNVRYIAIDEISVKKGHKYITLVMDIEKGNVIFVGDGKGSDALKPFWEKLRRSRAQIKAVSMDMSIAYISAAQENLPNTPIVFDHFHMVKLMNEALSEIRRGLYHEQKELMGKDVLKGSRWLLLKNPENLSEERNEKERLEEALKMNEPLSIAYYMKEDLRQFWSQGNKETAERVINDWLKRAQKTGIRPLQRVAQTVAILKFGILNWYDHPISSGRIEGTNNKIKVLKRMAYGYRDMEFFKLRIKAIHEAKYALTG